MRELDNGQVLWGSGTDSRDSVKLGLEYAVSGFREVDPESTDRSVGPADWAELADVVAGHLPGLGPVPERVAVCMYSRTPDGQFIIGRHPGDPRLIIAGGCNAHGGKHALGIGEALADLVTGTRSRIPLEFADPGRFRDRGPFPAAR